MVLTTLAINCWPVSTPPPITFSSAIKCINREAFSFCKSANRVARMRTTAICLELLECHLVQTKTTVFSLVASGASDQDVWGIYGCIFSWRFHAESEKVIILIHIWECSLRGIHRATKSKSVNFCDPFILDLLRA